MTVRCRSGIEMFQRVGGLFVGERADDARRVLRRQLADDPGEIGRAHARQPVLADGEPDLVGVEVVQRRDVVPRDERARDARDQARRDAPAAEPAQQPRDADVRGDDADRAGRARQLEVVDAHDLAAVDVDDLLVEEVFDQVQRLVVGRRVDRRRRRRAARCRRRRSRAPSRSARACGPRASSPRPRRRAGTCPRDARRRSRRCGRRSCACRRGRRPRSGRRAARRNRRGTPSAHPLSEKKTGTGVPRPAAPARRRRSKAPKAPMRVLNVELQHHTPSAPKRTFGVSRVERRLDSAEPGQPRRGLSTFPGSGVSACGRLT